MRKLLLSTALTLSVGAFALQSPAIADISTAPGGTVVVTAHIDKDKDKRVVELIAKLKVAAILVFGVFTGKSAAEADLMVDQQNKNNTVTHENPSANLPAGRKGSVELTATIRGSVLRNTGIAQLNQDTGNMVNQANVLSAAVSGGAVFVDSQAAAQQDNIGNTSTTIEVVPSGNFVPANAQKTALITGSINLNSGIVGVNQNVGNMNNQLNAVSLAVGLEADFALADAALGQFNTGNKVHEFGTIRTATITGSVNNNTGITGVNQATGNMNNQATVISFAGSAQF